MQRIGQQAKRDQVAEIGRRRQPRCPTNLLFWWLLFQPVEGVAGLTPPSNLCNLVVFILKTKNAPQKRSVFISISNLRGSGRASQTLGETALFTRCSIFVDDAFSGSAVDDADGEIIGSGERFLDFGLDTGFSGLITQTLFFVLAQALLG
jgi:hypothetical protein